MFANLESVVCRLDEVYLHLEHEGAVALVLVAPYKPSGLFHFLRENGCDQHDMIMVRVLVY